MDAAIHEAVGDLDGSGTEAGVGPRIQDLIRILTSNGECHIVGPEVPAEGQQGISRAKRIPWAAQAGMVCCPR